jgi:pimeloyl-ACP methyl ester carboxylesterase
MSSPTMSVPMMIDSTDGVRVALHDLGGTGPPLLILHATGFHAHCYAALAEHLHEHFHVWAPDLRGHGDSVTPDMALPWRGMVDDALACIDHLDPGEPIRACGHSMGGATVLGVELRRPATLRSAWLFEPIVFPPLHRTPGGNPMAATARKRRADFLSFDEAMARFTDRPPFTHVDPRVLRDYVVHGFRETDRGVTLKCSPETEARVFDGVDLTLFDRLAEIGTDVTVVASGDSDGPARLAPVVAGRLANGRLRGWPDRTHFGPFEDPARAAAEIVSALA